MQPTIESGRLLLRPYRLTDAPEVRRLAGDIRIADTTTTIPHPYPEGAAEAWISAHSENYDARSDVTFAVTLREGGGLLGTVSLLDISAKDSRAELGYWVGADYWSKGYCTEAVCRLIPFAYQALAVTRLVARCLARNTASARVMEKAGLRREGHLVKHVVKNGRYEDVLLYGLLLPGRESET